MLYVSPTQINLQMPAEGSIVVSTPAGTSSPFDPYTATPNTWYAGGIFSMDGSGCGQGAVLNIGADGELSVNSPTNSASPGNWIAIYGTGLAEFLRAPIGGAAPSNPVIASESGAGVGAEFDFAAANGPVWGWAGLAPGYVGLDQVNVQIPTDIR